MSQRFALKQVGNYSYNIKIPNIQKEEEYL